MYGFGVGRYFSGRWVYIGRYQAAPVIRLVFEAIIKASSLTTRMDWNNSIVTGIQIEILAVCKR